MVFTDRAYCTSDKPCRNDALCEDVEDGYVCHCRDGFTGRNCSGKYTPLSYRQTDRQTECVCLCECMCQRNRGQQKVNKLKYIKEIGYFTGDSVFTEIGPRAPLPFMCIDAISAYEIGLLKKYTSMRTT